MPRLPKVLLSALSALLLLPNLALAASGDLALSNENVNFSTNVFLEGSLVRITATVNNNSPNDLLGTVRFSQNGNTINGDQPISALAGQTDAVFVDWIPDSFGEFTIQATVIPWDPTSDNPNNNTVIKTVYIGQDTDRDGIPNDQDADDDNDGVNDDQDEFPLNGSEQVDTDGDGTGDNADTDDDNDGVNDDQDAFPNDSNYSVDTDGDGIPNENDEDMDGDGIDNETEVAQGTDPWDTDSDQDGVSDNEDPFPVDSSENQDTDGDGIGDSSDPDIDGDGTPNEEDPFPYNAPPVVKTNKNTYVVKLNEAQEFNASSDNEDQELEFAWSFGDETLEGQAVEKSFDTRGLQTATVTVFDELGQSSSKEIRVRVINAQFLLLAILFALILILLAFTLIYRYNRRALDQKQVKSTAKTEEKVSSKPKKKSSTAKKKVSKAKKKTKKSK